MHSMHSGMPTEIRKKKSKPQRTAKVLCVTGTPGCGKTTFCEELVSLAPAGTELINVGNLIKEKDLFDEWDDEMNCSIFDEKKLKREITTIISNSRKNFIIIDFHSIGFLPAPLVDLVIVLQCDNTVLWDRLVARGYDEKKVKENVEAEIFQESLSEAMDTFDEDKVVPLSNNSGKEKQKNLKKVLKLFF
jgi:adenylate kinase